MFLNKKAFVMPIIMVFVIISQIVYLNLTRLQQNQLLRAKLFKDFYYSQIIFSMTNESYFYSMEEKTATFEQFVSLTLDNILEVKFSNYQLNYQDEVGQVILLEEKDNRGRPAYILIKPQLFIAEAEQDLCDHLSTFNCSGILKQDGNTSKIESNNEIFNKFHLNLIDLGFRYQKLPELYHRDYLQMGLKSDDPYFFNEGRVEIVDWSKWEMIHRKAYNSAGELVTTEEIPLSKIDFQLEIEVQYYQYIEEKFL